MIMLLEDEKAIVWWRGRSADPLEVDLEGCHELVANGLDHPQWDFWEAIQILISSAGF